jgi:hypothetical protein
MHDVIFVKDFKSLDELFKVGKGLGFVKVSFSLEQLL